MKKILSPVLILVIGFFLSSCGATNTYNSYEEGFDQATSMDMSESETYDQAYEEMDDEPADEEVDYSLSASEERQIERNFYYSTDTVDYEADKGKIDSLVSKYDGYTEASSMSKDKIYNTDQERRTASITIKIPSDTSDDFRKELEEIGEITSSNNYISDLTQSFTDINIRLDSKKAELDKLNDLLEKADNIDDVMAIQARILEVQADIDQIEANKRDLDKRVAYDTYEIYLAEVYSYNDMANRNPDFGSRIGRAFGDSIHIFINFIQDIVIALVTIWPLLIIVGIIIYLIIRKRKKSKINPIDKEK